MKLCTPICISEMVFKTYNLGLLIIIEFKINQPLANGSPVKFKANIASSTHPTTYNFCAPRCTAVPSNGDHHITSHK